MQLRSGIIVSNMSKASSSSDEGMNERGNNNARNTEPVTMSTSQNVENNIMPPRTSVAATSSATVWPLYGLPLRYTPPGFVPPVSSKANIGIMPNVLQNNHLYQNLPSMAHLPQLGIFFPTFGNSCDTNEYGDNR